MFFLIFIQISYQRNSEYTRYFTSLQRGRLLVTILKIVKLFNIHVKNHESHVLYKHILGRYPF